jgi:hypothetical protein
MQDEAFEISLRRLVLPAGLRCELDYSWGRAGELLRRLATSGLQLLPFENFPDVYGELRHIKRDVCLAPVRHMAPLGRYHASRYFM